MVNIPHGIFESYSGSCGGYRYLRVVKILFDPSRQTQLWNFYKDSYKDSCVPGLHRT